MKTVSVFLRITTCIVLFCVLILLSKRSFRSNLFSEERHVADEERVVNPPLRQKLFEKGATCKSTNISHAVQTLTMADKSYVSYEERRAALLGTGVALNDNEVAMAVEFLRSSGEQTPGLTLAERLDLKNDVLDVLQRQEASVVGLSEILVEMFDDTRHPVAWRDYCLQGFVSQYQLARRLEDKSEGERESIYILAAFRSVFHDLDKGSFRGTALRGMDILAQEFPETIITNDMIVTIREILDDPLADENTLITALRMSSGYQVFEVQDKIRDIAERGQTSLLKKVAQKTLEDFSSLSRMQDRK